MTPFAEIDVMDEINSEASHQSYPVSFVTLPPRPLFFGKFSTHLTLITHCFINNSLFKSPTYDFAEMLSNYLLGIC